MLKKTDSRKRIMKIIRMVVVMIFGLLVIVAATIAILFKIADRTNGKLVSSGQVRRYLLHVPDSYDASNPVPLVISIHGFIEWPAHQAKISGWNDLADKEGFIVVYPSGTGFPKRWLTNGSSMQDVIFISDLIDELEKQYNIDPARIYANGLSNGGGMSFLLGCKLSDRIAAIGGVAGAYSFPLDDCDPSRFVPMIAFHGTDDPIVNYHGQPGREGGNPLPDIPQWIAAMAVEHNCVSDAAILLAEGNVSGVQYSGCTDGADVILYTVKGGGHTWPGGYPLPEWLTGITSQDINATHMMWDFFTQFSLGD
jgi:polyhydroxybutyrate depolymerase